MIQKIKDLVKIRELVDQISERVKSQEEVIDSHTEKMDGFKSEMKESMQEILESHSAVKDQIRSDLDEFSQLQSRLRDELTNFRLFKNESRKIFMDRADREFHELRKKLKSEISGINELRNAINSRSDDIYALSDEIKRLKEVTSKIKSQDFELSHHKKLMDKNEREKLAMTKQIDSLQRLVARMRRR